MDANRDQPQAKTKAKVIQNSLQSNTDHMDANQHQAQAKTKVIYRLLLGNSRPTTNKSNSQLTLGKHRPSETLHLNVLHLIQLCFSEENFPMLSDKY